MPSEDKTTYWLDENEVIVRVCSSWDSFALENEGEEVLGCRVVSKPIWDFVSGDVSKMWLRTLIDLCRITKKPVERPYRCDSPEMRRYMKMVIIPEEGGFFRIDHLVEELERREQPVYIYPGTTPGVFFRCSVCGRIEKDDRWHEPDQEGVLSMQEKGRCVVAYTVCDDCVSTG